MCLSLASSTVKQGDTTKDSQIAIRILLGWIPHDGTCEPKLEDVSKPTSTLTLTRSAGAGSEADIQVLPAS